MAWSNRIIGRGEGAPSELNAHPANWRTHGRSQRASLVALLDRVGWVQDVIVNRRTGRLVDGHLRVLLAEERGEPSIPILYVDLDEDEEALVLATLDPIAALAGTDESGLSDLLKSIEIDGEAVEQLLRTVADASGVAIDQPDEGAQAPDDIPDVEAAVSMPGDLWILGRHRVLCGDARLPGDVNRLFGSARAAWMWTDPPYGVEYVGRTANQLTISNDVADELPSLLAGVFAEADRVLKPGAPIYCATPAGRLSLTFGQAFEDAGWHLHQALVWVKDALVLGHSDYQYRHEPVLYGWKPPGRRWLGGRSESTVFEVPRPTASPDHPTAKPVVLIERQLRNSSVRGSVGYDRSVSLSSVSPCRVRRRLTGRLGRFALRAVES